MAAPRHFYVYVVSTPDGEPCYVGKGRGGRWKQHITNSHNKWLQRLFAKYRDAMTIVKVREGPTNEEAVLTEMALIRALGRADRGLGSLVNFTDGGDGATGIVRSEETRNRLSAALIGRKLSPEAIKASAEAHRGLKRTAETKLRMSIAQKGWQRSITPAIAAVHESRRGKAVPQFIEANKARKGQPKTPEHAQKLRDHLARTLEARTEKIRIALAGRPLTKEQIASMPQCQKGVKKSEAHCKALSEAHRGAKLSEAHKAAIGAAHVGRKNTPETIEKMRIAQRLRAERIRAERAAIASESPP